MEPIGRSPSVAMIAASWLLLPTFPTLTTVSGGMLAALMPTYCPPEGPREKELEWPFDAILAAKAPLAKAAAPRGDDALWLPAPPIDIDAPSKGITPPLLIAPAAAWWWLGVLPLLLALLLFRLLLLT